MELCHIKGSELPEKGQSWKGRVAFRGDNVKDESGYLAVFSEQGTSASNLEAAKFLDAISRLPGNDGEDADATWGLHAIMVAGHRNLATSTT